ncbi:hypothetical protein AB6735_06220 [Mucilaginibacter sp. RCC_168]|uniref:hypothetical protein n=1 Tax=Mucilaginibacter sp. RCC_168 TaxID=3239221 RepID=UPI0035247D0E
MKSKPSLSRVLGFLLVLATLQSCEPTQPGSWKNEQISNPDKFHKLNDELLKQLKVNDEKQLENIMSNDFINTLYKNRHIELVSNRVKVNDYILLDEYYVVNRYISGDTISSGVKGPAGYSLTYQGATHEMYFAFFVPKDKTIPNQDMIAAVYCKYNYGWKLSQLDVSRYKVNSKTAPELCDQARECYNKGFLIDALNISSSAIDCSRPSDLWKYNSEEDMSNFYNKVLREAYGQYKFPVAIKQVSTHPRIIRIMNQTTPEGVFPMIYYVSSIKLKDTTAIKQENENIKKMIGQTLPGIDQDKKYVLYSAFNESPSGIKTVDHFDMIAKLK